MSEAESTCPFLVIKLWIRRGLILTELIHGVVLQAFASESWTAGGISHNQLRRCSLIGVFFLGNILALVLLHAYLALTDMSDAASNSSIECPRLSYCKESFAYRFLVLTDVVPCRPMP